MDSLWIITSYFNWNDFQSKLNNYWVFRSNLQKIGANVLTVECALLDHPFNLPPGRDVMHVRTASILWQKERLLNIALDSLPSSCRFVAWVDCDLIFESNTLLKDIIYALQNSAVAQIFDQMVRLPRGRSQRLEDDPRSGSFVGGLYESANQPVTARVGHPGFAWAARRDILERCNGFYDVCIVGGADRVMAHAFLGDYHAPIVSRIAVGSLTAHYLSWAENAYSIIRGSVSLVKGTVLHLWHGASENRLYFERHQPLIKFGFDPVEDLAQNKWACWEWATNKPDLHDWIRLYFGARKEDD